MCVICGKPKDERYRPFCSKRCAQLDLNRWFSGGYAIPAEEEREPGDSEGER
ncbi:MAG: DNA gyrase inhibitor YacG [Terricaulis sp.]